ncbi:hypothetical protein M9H77_29962 [Catharanthus roseus]|uniref:Uncharacterized protein n=1 Tax=Catharanthus roseus TaxID=4058 RepID=A0ACB9ZXR8_CATRO|nr:hypothetical protein M9H77_29962 [Catharanthus roseus]
MKHVNAILVIYNEEVPSRSRNDEKEIKIDENRAKTTKMKAENCNPRPTTDGMPHPTVGGSFYILCYRISSFVQGLLSWIQELKTLIQDFNLQLGDSKDDLRRHYSQGCLELKKEEQSRATNWGLITLID